MPEFSLLKVKEGLLNLDGGSRLHLQPAIRAKIPCGLRLKYIRKEDDTTLRVLPVAGSTLYSKTSEQGSMKRESSHKKS
jgi:hypothetical protein